MTGADVPEGRSYRQRHALNSAAMLASDGAVILAALLLSDVALHLLVGTKIGIRLSGLLIPAWWAAAGFLCLLPGWGLGLVEEVRRTSIALMIVWGAAAVGIFFGRVWSSSSRFNFLVPLLLCSVGLPLARRAARELLVRRGWWGAPAVVYGSGISLPRMIEALAADPSLGYHPCGVFTEDPGAERVGGVRVIGTLHEATDLADIAFLALPHDRAHDVPALLDGPLSRYRRVFFMPDFVGTPTLWVESVEMAGQMGLEIANHLLDPLSRGFKAFAERALVLLLLPLLFPLIGLIALLVWLQDFHGPFYLQERIGREGRPFRAVKFRTMVPAAEALLNERLRQDERLREQWGVRYKLESDPRVTRFGRFLRRSSLDELPQLWHVLTGTMALVGPRPLPAYHYERLSGAAKRLRERVRPGITGLWQVSGRHTMSQEDFEKWDAYYVRNWSIWLDIVILARTVAAVLGKRGAW